MLGANVRPQGILALCQILSWFHITFRSQSYGAKPPWSTGPGLIMHYFIHGWDEESTSTLFFFLLLSKSLIDLQPHSPAFKKWYFREGAEGNPKDCILAKLLSSGQLVPFSISLKFWWNPSQFWAFLMLFKIYIMLPSSDKPAPRTSKSRNCSRILKKSSRLFTFVICWPEAVVLNKHMTATKNSNCYCSDCRQRWGLMFVGFVESVEDLHQKCFVL